MNKLCLDVKEVAESLGISRRLVYELVKRGTLPHVKIGAGRRRIIRIPMAAIAEWLKRETRDRSISATSNPKNACGWEET